MVTQMIQRAGVLWHQDDVSPPPPLPQKEPVTIPWGSWVHEKPASRRRSRARATVEGAGPSSSSAPVGASTSVAALPMPPPAAPQPTYLLVQRLFRYMERKSFGSDEETHEEEQPDLHDEETHEEEPVHVEVPPQTQETQPQPVPQLEPKPTGVPIPDPQD
ncbi:uncharacterized protein LOC130950162 [Arachis stenosperma]|uniref:uncharacterized protein LOC130950162 n=1 Tax=Arachis stenosperma TaxID=217475 RepID=UPI0025ABA66B|nr:uncharacterized protein LOC130950162 [Arachis stenosperma]